MAELLGVLSTPHETVAAIEAECGPIDRVMNGAAIMPTGLLMNKDSVLINRIMEINYGGTVNVTMATLPRMRERGSGLVVNVSSGFGQSALQEMPGGEGSPGIAYGASKAGLDRMTVGLAKELRPFGVCVVSVDPGFTLSEHCETLASAGGIDPQWAHPMAVPAGIVADVVCDPDPMARSGEILDAPGAVPEP